MISFKNRTIAGTAAILATVFTVAAATPLRAETFSTEVAYGDLDISKPAGEAALLRRINHAATKVCGPVDALNRFDVAQCRRQAIAMARMNMHLAAVDAGRRDAMLAAR